METIFDIDPVLDRLIEQEAKRQGISKSEFVSKVLERALSPKSPMDIYLSVIDKKAYEVTSPTTFDSFDVSQKVRDKLLAKRNR